MKPLGGELLGTFLLVFAGTGAMVVNDATGALTHVGVALTFGLVVLALIYALGDVSGAHLNPAVTLGFWLARRFPTRQVLPYLLAQCAGALLASGLLRALFPTDAGLGSTHPAGAVLQSFVLEGVLTFFLMFVILAVSTGSREKGAMAGIAVGAVIGLEALFAGPICGASMNPARSLGPALVSGHLGGLWIYLGAPVLGSALAVPVACYLLAPAHNPSPGGSSMPRDLHPATYRILFVCIENSNRSQMAEAFARLHGGDRVEAYSAGSRPSGVVNPRAIAFMKEIGYDLAQHTSKALDDIPDGDYAAAVTMGCGDACPLVQAQRREDWNIPDPKQLPDDQFRHVRDLIEEKVKGLLASLAGAHVSVRKQ